MLAASLAVWQLTQPTLFACASAPVQKPSYRSPSAPPPSQVVRPADSADYDVLVAGMVAEDGNLAEARAAFERAAEKDPESAYLQRRLGNLAAQMDDLPGALYFRQSRNGVTVRMALLDLILGGK